MTEAEWLACEDPKPMLAFLRGRTSDRKLRLFACGVCRRLASLVRIEEYVRGIEAAESYADGGRMKAAMKRCRQVLDKRMVATVDSSGSGQSKEWHALYLGHLAICERDYRNFAANLSDVRSYWRGDPFAGMLTDAHLLVHDIFGNPFRPATFSPEWRTDTAVALARQMYEAREFGAMPILADALQDAGCDDAALLDHCRGPGPHVRGCWVVDLVLGKE